MRTGRAAKALTPTLSLRERGKWSPSQAIEETAEPTQPRPLSLRERVG